MQLCDRKVIVTGGASGMGRHFCLRLAECGATVYASDINEEGLASLVDQGNGRISSGLCDVSREDQVVEMVSDACRKMGGLNGLINNAGIFLDSMLVKKESDGQTVRKMPLEKWQKVIDIDLTGPFLCTREFAAKLIETDTRAGVVVNISSVSRHGNQGQSNYSAAKAGLVADTKLWGLELARYGIRVGAIAPGFIHTPILDAMRPEIVEGVIKRIPLRRLGEPEEIWQGIRFILECDYFTGRCLDIDGGVVV